MIKKGKIEMKKLGLLITFLMIISLGTVNAIFERTKSFFTGRRYYYDTDVYYDPYCCRYYYTSYYPGYVYYEWRPYYYVYDKGVTPQAVHHISIHEEDGQYVISIPLPGYTKSDIRVSALERSLHIVASAPKGEDYGLATVSIDQTIPLSGYIQPDAVTSEYENGILTIKAPRENIAAAKGVKVPVK
jgi:HSP20 family molecular chaperone IbpA